MFILTKTQKESNLHLHMTLDQTVKYSSFSGKYFSYLPEHPQEHLGQTAPTTVCTLVLMSTPVFQTYTNGLLST